MAVSLMQMNNWHRNMEKVAATYCAVFFLMNAALLLLNPNDASRSLEAMKNEKLRKYISK